MESVAPRVSDALLDDFRAILGDENVITSEESVEKLSKDFYWYSPVLKRQLEDKRADAALKVSSLEDLKRVVSLCAGNGVPITVRGGGTGNYGQCVPLYGGVVLDLAGMDTIFSVDGAVRCEPGARLGTIEMEARKAGWELRCMPSTWVKSSMGGFLCGGSGGIGSITYGGINHSDNMKSVTLLTVEEEPQLIKFEERDSIKALHTYGTTGILVECEMRLGRKRRYDQLVFVSDDWDRLLSWSNAVARDKKWKKRLVTQFEWPIPSYFLPLKRCLPEDRHATFVLVDEEQTDALIADAEAAGIEHTRTIEYTEPMRPPYVTDYTWNHTTLWALKKDPSITYLQCGFGENADEKFRRLWDKFPGEVLIHLEWTLDNAKLQANVRNVNVGGIPLIRFQSEERLQEIIDYCREIGIFVADPHTYKLELGGAHPDIEEKRELKRRADPHGILNPGKMSTYPDNPFESGNAAG